MTGAFCQTLPEVVSSLMAQLERAFEPGHDWHPCLPASWDRTPAVDGSPLVRRHTFVFDYARGNPVAVCRHCGKIEPFGDCRFRPVEHWGEEGHIAQRQHKTASCVCQAAYCGKRVSVLSALGRGEEIE